LKKKDSLYISPNINEDSEVFTWDKIEVISKLGAGAQGTVKKIQHKDSKKFYAMKVITLEENIKPKVIISEFKALYESCSDYIIGMHEAFYRDS